MTKQLLIWGLRLTVAILLLLTLRFKFTAHPQSVYIFTTIGLEPYGRIGIGVFELLAAITLLIPRWSVYGAILSAGLMLGALFFHVTTLGIEVDGDPNLFYTACLILALSLLLTLLQWADLKPLLQRILPRKNNP